MIMLFIGIGFVTHGCEKSDLINLFIYLFAYDHLLSNTAQFHNDIYLFTEIQFPRFAEPIPNVTVTVGRDALLACVVDNLRNYKVNIIIIM